NPLFVEQMAAMAAEAGEGAPLAVPPTIQALLAARLDRLEPEERAVIERAAVVGRGFWRSAVHDLAPPELRDSVGHQLMALVRKELILPDTAKFEREDAFRFRHVLIRDVAYDGMPKQLRADLHERFSDWLDEHERERAVEFEEIRGYHLEQAYRLREQLGPVDERTRSLAERAAYVLGAAGRRAFARDDAPAAVSLLDRALALATEQDPARLELQRELSYALWAVGEVARAESLLNGLLEAAAAAGDRRQEWYAILDRSARRHTAGGETADELLRVAEEAVEIFRGLDDHVGLARAWRRVSLAHRMCNRYEIAGEAAEKAIRHAREAGDAQEEARAVDILCTSLLFGPTHAETAIERCHEVLAGARRTPLLEANVASSLAGLEAMVGDVDAARARCLDAAAIFEELGLRMTLAGLSQIAGMVELLAGDGVGAEEWLRRGLEILGSGASSGLHYSLLAHSLYEQGRHDEAEEVARAARAVALPGETHQQVLWRTATARLAILHADEERGEALARGAVRLTDDTDALNLRADALVVLAEVLDALELDEDAAAARADATELYRRKGNVAALALFERSRRRIVDGSAARARRERR
ncbi:MAG TPA: hypothetical protein VF101_14540, partial [Gaiellaceae bacterium]